MSGKDVTGIFFYHPGNGMASSLNFDELKKYSERFKQIDVIWDSTKIPFWDKEFVGLQIKNKKLTRLIIAGYDTGMIKPFFSRIFSEMGIPVENIVVADFKEQGILRQGDENLAKVLITCSVYQVPFDDAWNEEREMLYKDTLVIGGGIAGIQASLEIAMSNHKVYLVEKTGTIGGHMAMFDKTFPTLDCAACILTPKMVEVGQNPNIELLSYSEVKSVTGSPGNYKVKILKKARRVNESMCIGCGTCSEKCPSKVTDEFNAGTTLRNAIYIPFPQAIPNKYLIDESSCRYLQGKKCGACVKACPVPGCINLDEKDQEVEISVGNIIVCTGYKTFDAKRIKQYGYGKIPNVLTSLEFERLLNASGPTDGKITFRSEDKKGNKIFKSENDEPESIAVFHCVGSRDENYNRYCSKVCCMYSLKLSYLIKDKLPGTEVYEYYIDMRTYGKGYEEFYERTREKGVHIIRGRSFNLKEKGDHLVIRGEDIERGKLIEQEVEMVILSVGVEPAEDASEMAKMCGISVDENGWFVEANFISDSVKTLEGGVMIAGMCQGSKDIPDSVAQASAAAAVALRSIINGKIRKSIREFTLEEMENKVKKLSHIHD